MIYYIHIPSKAMVWHDKHKPEFTNDLTIFLNPCMQPVLTLQILCLDHATTREYETQYCLCCKLPLIVLNNLFRRWVPTPLENIKWKWKPDAIIYDHC